MTTLDTLIDNIESYEDEDDIMTGIVDLEEGIDFEIMSGLNELTNEGVLEPPFTNPVEATKPTKPAKPVKEVKVKEPSKMDHARTIYTTMKGEGKVRKDIISAFMDPNGTVQLTAAGAATYYQKLSKV